MDEFEPLTLQQIHTKIEKITGNRDSRFRVRNTHLLQDYLIMGPSMIDTRRKKTLPPLNFRAYNYEIKGETTLKSDYPFYALLSSDDEIDWLNSRHIDVVKRFLEERTKDAAGALGKTKKSGKKSTTVSEMWDGT